MKKFTTEELINRYWIVRQGNMLGVRSPSLAKKEGAIEEIKARKAEILAYFDEQERQKQELEAKIDAIEGLEEIRKAIRDIENWHYEWERSFKDVGGFGVRKKPQYDMEALHKKYPRASAYLKAEAMENKRNYELAAIGRRAKERIINGEDVSIVLADMNAEQEVFTEKHAWD